MDANNIPPSTGVQHSAWAEDWSAKLDTDTYINSLPNGIDTLNIFVGQLDANGSISGFSTAGPGSGTFTNQAELKDFITKLKAKGISVKLSIGGKEGTPFGDSWSNLTAANTGSYATALNTICTNTGADGIDFDEEMADVPTATLAGGLAVALKNLNPDLSLTTCVFMGTDATAPGTPANLAFLLATKMPDGTSAIDHVATMPYGDGLSVEANDTQTDAWAAWLHTNLNMDPSQLSMGVDPTEDNTSYASGNLKTSVEYAKAHGYGTAVWDDKGVEDYQKNDWGTVVSDLYNGITPPPRPPAAHVQPGGHASAMQYTIAAGDTFFNLAKNFGVSTDMLTALNPGIDPSTLAPGQKINIPAGDAYTVAAGDSGYKIAQHFGTTLDALTALNPGVDLANLSPGQVLMLPPGHAWEVQAGDSASAIATAEGVSIDAVEAANPGVDWANIQPGQILATGVTT